MKRVAISIALLASLAPRSTLAADPAACVAANERAIKERESLALRAALKDYAICAEATCPSEVSTECARQLHDVKLAIPSVVFVAKDGEGNDLTNVKVTIDGQPLVDSLDARAVPIDPGDHTFVLTAAGHPSVTKRLLVREGERDRREPVVFGASSVVLPPVTTTTTTAHDKTWRVMGVTLAGVGLAGVVLGSIFGSLAISAKNQQEGYCDPNSTTCTGSSRQLALEAHAHADTFATVSTVSFIAGPAFLVLGGVVFFAAPVVRTDGAAIAIGGSF